MEEKTCSVCGESYKSGLDYCPFCLSNFIPVENRNDKYECGYYKEAEEHNFCKCGKKCYRKECTYQGNKGKQAIIILLSMIVICYAYFGINFISNKYETYKQNEIKKEEVRKIAEQKQNQEINKQRQQRFKEIVNLLNVAQQEGIIKGISKFQVENKTVAYAIVDEYTWNQLPHETKKQLCVVIQEYNELSEVPILSFRGYRTGKDIMPYAFSVHNF